MKRQMWVPAAGMLLGAAALVAGLAGPEENGFTLPQYHNADAKFLEDHVITSVDEKIQILNLKGEVVQQFDDLSASWFYVQEEVPEEKTPEEKMAEGGAYRAVAYSNHAGETHILRLALSEDWELIKDQVVLQTDVLSIDPILFKKGDTWFLTHTWIEGTVNNPSPEGENGTYTVKLYRSEDLEEWEYVTDIISRKQNLEDGDIRCAGDTLYYFFEMEQYDKGPSAVCVMTSEDNGETWNGPKELLPATADNEMAGCEPSDTGWRLYVSSDRSCVGESYQGASVYYADYTPDFEPVCTYQLSAMPDNRSVRLYEVKEIDGQLCFLFARNFLTDCDLLLRTLEEE